MLYPASAYLNLIFLFLGAFLGSLVCIFCGKIFKKKYLKFRLSFAFLLLAIAIIFVVLLLLKIKSSENLDMVLENFYSRIFVLSIYMVVGFFCAAFLRSVFPMATVLYIAFTFWFGIALYKQLPQIKDFPIAISETFVREESTGAEYKFASSIEEAESAKDALCYIVFNVYELNENALLPLPSVWYKMRCVASKKEELMMFDNAPDFSMPFTTDDSPNNFQKIFFDLCKKILGLPHYIQIEVPFQQVYPSLFNLKINIQGADFNATLERIM